jgi:hypothetical protein
MNMRHPAIQRAWLFRAVKEYLDEKRDYALQQRRDEEREASLLEQWRREERRRIEERYREAEGQ